MSAFRKSIRERISSMLPIEPVERLSIPRTCAPSARRALAMLDPIKPAIPVTRMVGTVPPKGEIGVQVWHLQDYRRMFFGKRGRGCIESSILRPGGTDGGS